MQNSILLENISEKELYSKIRAIISEEIEARFKPEAPKKLLTKQEVAEKLRCSLAKIKRMVTDGRLKGYRNGRHVLFRADEIDQVLIEIQSIKYKKD